MADMWPGNHLIRSWWRSAFLNSVFLAFYNANCTGLSLLY